MNLCVFDIDGTLTQSVALDDQCFVAAFADVLEIQGINTDWLNYQYQTDSGLAIEICERHLGRLPEPNEVAQLRQRFLERLESAAGAGQRIVETPGANAFLHSALLREQWHVAIATGGWKASACFKLRSAGLLADSFPMATADDAVDRIDILRMAIQRAEEMDGRQARTIVYVGDNLWDFRAATRLGLGFIGIASGDIACRLRHAGVADIFPDFQSPAAIDAALSSLEMAHTRPTTR